MSKPIKFTVPCVARINNHIGHSLAHISAYAEDDFEVECVTNEYSALSGDLVSDALLEEINEEVSIYFALKKERETDEERSQGFTESDRTDEF